MAANGDRTIGRAAIMKLLGLNVPVYVQYGRWVSNIVVHGSFGTSLRSSQPITPMIMQRLPLTFELGFMAFIIGLLISIPIGVYSAIREDTIMDYVLRSLSILLISIPGFWLGTMIVLYPSIWWHWAPPMEFIPFFKNPIGNLGMMIIPALVLGSQQPAAR